MLSSDISFFLCKHFILLLILLSLKFFQRSLLSLSPSWHSRLTVVQKHWQVLYNKLAQDFDFSHQLLLLVASMLLTYVCCQFPYVLKSKINTKLFSHLGKVGGSVQVALLRLHHQKTFSPLYLDVCASFLLLSFWLDFFQFFPKM